MLCLSTIALGLLTLSADAFPSRYTKRQAPELVPRYVLDYAPLVYLDPAETFFPSDITSFLRTHHPQLNGVAVTSPDPLTLSNLDQLNPLGGADIYLTSNDDFTTEPQWTQGIRPDSTGAISNAISSVVISHERDTHVDAFYFHWYAYNKAPPAFSQQLGIHVGDWEHIMVRFDKATGKPQGVWLSAHGGGGAFQYDALEKLQGTDRAVVYSSRGSHALYATEGTHDHTVPGIPLEFGPLLDYTGKGALWDTVKNAWFYKVEYADSAGEDDSSSLSFSAYDGQADIPVQWLMFKGHWGDKQLGDDDGRQREFAGFVKYTNGPTGPRDKKLNRSKVCPKGFALCIVKDFLPPGS